MLKPNYSRREINANYKLGYGLGNEYFDETKSRGIIEYLLNGHTIRLIPPYNLSKFDFPPTLESLKKIQHSHRYFNSMDEHRYYAFFHSEIVFYVNDDRLGETLVLDFKSEDLIIKHYCLVHFISTEIYQELYKEAREKLPFVYGRIPPNVKRNSILDLKVVQFLDRKIVELKPLLSEGMLESLEISN